MSIMLKQHSQEENCGFIPIDACNFFNRGERKAMMWPFWCDWISGAQFTFKCYYNQAILVIKTMVGMGQFLHNKEGVTQGDLLIILE